MNMTDKEKFSLVIAVWERNGAAFRIDVECEARGYSFKFWDENDKHGNRGRAEEMVRQMNYFNPDSWEGGIFRKVFEYPDEEDDLYRYIATFMDTFATVTAG
jgi:hypothetical protein